MRTLEPKAVALGDLTVTAASKEPERIVEAPAAVSSIEPRVLQATGATGQAPLALAQTPGVDIVQSGVNDFNINARGFNSSLNRRVLTLLDGRDLAIDFLGSQEWNSLTVSTEDMRGMELVRGPGSALYGPNAFAGVLNMTTLSPREALGGRVSASVGGLSLEARWMAATRRSSAAAATASASPAATAPTTPGPARAPRSTRSPRPGRRSRSRCAASTRKPSPARRTW